MIRFTARMLSTLLLSLSLLSVPGCSAPPGPEETAVRFIRAFAEGDAQEALELIYFPEQVRRDETAMGMANGKIMQMVATGRTRIAAKGGLRAIRALDTTVVKGGDERERVAVRLHCETADGTASEDVVHLIRIGEVWMVDLRV